MYAQIAEGQRQAAELRALATEVAAQIGYIVDPPQPDAYYRDAVRMSGPDCANLSLTYQWNKPGRIAIHGGYPHGTMQVAYGLPSHTITVAATRGAPAIAREIQRRLLPDYTADLAKAVVALNDRDSDVTAREKVVADLVAALPDLRRGIASDSRTSLSYYGDRDTYGSVEVCGRGDRVSVTLNGAADKLLPAFITALRDAK